MAVGHNTAEPIGDRQEMAAGSAEEGETETGEMGEADVPLVQKRRRLLISGKTEQAKENVAAEEPGSERDVARQGSGEPSGRESAAVPEATKSGDGGWVGGEEGQASLPLVLVPFEAVPKEEPVARRKQATKSRRLQVLTTAQDVLCPAPGRLDRIQGAG